MKPSRHASLQKIGWQMMRFRILSLLILAVGIASGCHRSSKIDEVSWNTQKSETLEVAAKNKNPIQNQSLSESALHSFGTIFCDDSILTHDFIITNQTPLPIRIVKTRTYTPCCSAVENVPTSIEPLASEKVTTTLKLGHRPGLKSADFLIETNSSEYPKLTLRLEANLITRNEIQPVSPSQRIFSVSSWPAKWLWRVTTRRKFGEKPANPEKIMIPNPLAASFIGKEERRELANNIIEITRNFEVTLFDSKDIFNNRTIVQVMCADGTILSDSLAWEVLPAIRVTPPGFIIHQSNHEVLKKVALASEKPFKVLAVTNPLSPDSTVSATTAQKHHLITLVFQTESLTEELARTVVVKTDLPEQPEIYISVVVLSGTENTQK